MSLEVEVVLDPEAGERPPPGTPLRVQLRDTGLADAPARVLAEAEASVSEGVGNRLGTVVLPVPEDVAPEDLSVWAHVDVTRTGDVTSGDYITMQSHRPPSQEQQPARLPVIVRPVR